MELLSFDHLLLTTSDLKKCLEFYEGILGMETVYHDGRYSLYFGMQKINIHTRPAEFLPAAAYPVSGSLDLCIRVEGSIEDAKKELLACGVKLEQDAVLRHGAIGTMKSLYIRDPDGNLIELGFYQE